MDPNQDTKQMTFAFTVSVTEAQLIRAALTKLPYETAAPVMPKIPETGAGDKATFAVSGAEVEIIGAALANMPYRMVAHLIANGQIGTMQMAINTQIAGIQQPAPAQPDPAPAAELPTAEQPIDVASVAVEDAPAKALRRGRNGKR